MNGEQSEKYGEQSEKYIQNRLEQVMKNGQTSVDFRIEHEIKTDEALNIASGGSNLSRMHLNKKIIITNRESN